jgi:hypothetical protein
MCFYFYPENFATPIARQDSMTSPASVPATSADVSIYFSRAAPISDY